MLIYCLFFLVYCWQYRHLQRNCQSPRSQAARLQLSTLSTSHDPKWLATVSAELSHNSEFEEDISSLLYSSFSVWIGFSYNSLVKGNLVKCMDFWKSVLHAPDYIISIIERGYALSFNDFPSVCHLKNNKSVFKHPSFVSNTIRELLRSNCIKECQFPPHCVNPLPLTVAQGKKLRLGLDLMHVNNFLVVPKFPFENLHSLTQVFNKNYWVFVFYLGFETQIFACGYLWTSSDFLKWDLAWSSTV